MKTILAAALLTMAMASPALAAQSDSCLRADQIDGFTDAKRDSVVLTEGGKRWLAETQGACPGLDWAQSVATVSSDVCVAAGDKLKFVDNGNFARTCLIAKLTKVEKSASN